MLSGSEAASFTSKVTVTDFPAGSVSMLMLTVSALADATECMVLDEDNRTSEKPEVDGDEGKAMIEP